MVCQKFLRSSVLEMQRPEEKCSPSMATFNFWRITISRKSKLQQNHFEFLFYYRDLIVKYQKIEDSIAAHDELIKTYQVQYVPTKHNSDEANNFNYIRTETYDRDARDATLTLNMFKIK